MMSSTNYCNDCGKFFDKAKIYQERHGLDAPPYERFAVCPRCGNSDFVEFETCIEKFDVAEKLVNIIALINRHYDDLKNIYGSGISNEELDLAQGVLAEMMCEMFDYMDANMQKSLFRIRSVNDANGFLAGLRG